MFPGCIEVEHAFLKVIACVSLQFLISRPPSKRQLLLDRIWDPIRNARLDSRRQFAGRHFSAGMHLCVMCELRCVQQLRLIFLFVRTVDAEVRLELLVQSFGLTVCLRVESCAHPMLNAQDMGEIRPVY